jgi:hypothetical protein
MGRWSRRGLHLQHVNALHDEAHIDLYLGDGLSAWRRLQEHWPRVKQAHLFRVQLVRIYLGWVRARSALAAAAQVEDPEPYLRAAERDAKAMWRAGAAYGQALAQMVFAGVAFGRKDRESAVDLLRDAVARCDATGMRLFAAAARGRLAELLIGVPGPEFWAQVEAWLHSPLTDHKALQNQVAERLTQTEPGPQAQRSKEVDRSAAEAVELWAQVEPLLRAQKPKSLGRLVALVLPGFGAPRV